MPLVEVKLIEGVFSADEKHQMMERVTDAMVSVYGEALRPSTWVLIEDVASGEWGIGGRAITSDMVQQMAGRVPAAAPAGT